MKSYLQNWKVIIFAFLSWVVAIVLIINAGFERVYYESWLGQKYEYPTQEVINFCMVALVEITIFYLILKHLKIFGPRARLFIILLISVSIAYLSLSITDMPPTFYAHGLWLGLFGITTLIALIASVFLKIKS